MADFVFVLLIRLVSFLLQQLPHRPALAVGSALGWTLSKTHSRRKVAYTNLKAAFGNQYDSRQRQQISERHFINLAQNAVEILRFPKLDLNYFSHYVAVNGRERYEQLINENRGVVLITPHFGNWELSQILSALAGRPLHVLARQQKHSRLDDFLNELRSSHGSTTVHKGGAVKELIRILRHKGLVGVLGDLSGGPDGVRVHFFGRLTTAPSGIFEIASRAEVDILPCFMVRINGPYHQVNIEEVFHLAKFPDGTTDIEGTVHKYYRLLEKWISKVPDQWFWMYKRWKRCFTKKILILKDERAGHTNQSEAIVQEFKRIQQTEGNEYEFEFKTVDVQFKSAFHKKLFYLFAFLLRPHAQGRLNLLTFFLSPQLAGSLQEEFADIIISTGSSLAPLNLLLKEENQAKSIVVMKPSFPYSVNQFDLSILPMHDRVAKKATAVIRTLIAPNQVSEEAIQKARERLSAYFPPKNGHKRLGIFIGGESKSYRFNTEEFKKWVSELKECTKKLNYELLITTSRRTNGEISKNLKQEFSTEPSTKLLVIANESNLDQVTYGMLADCDVAVITEDSVSMISEAISAGKPVLVLQIGNGKLPKKHQQFHRLLAEQELVQLVSPAHFYKVLEHINGTEIKTIRDHQSQKIQEALKKLL